MTKAIGRRDSDGMAAQSHVTNSTKKILGGPADIVAPVSFPVKNSFLKSDNNRRAMDGNGWTGSGGNFEKKRNFTTTATHGEGPMSGRRIGTRDERNVFVKGHPGNF
ncbi:hypothetical protein RUM44_001385 [Polyplax serrata]|uniref:Microtubule-associated protein Jupiter n=1 Tax=Polyplax serrata TaxID=468196 RepID=A0ABR1AJW6_POLSC